MDCRHPVDFDDFLIDAGPERAGLLVELAHIDLELRSKAERKTRVDSLFSRYTELSADPETAMNLIAAEYDFRCRREPDLSIDEYLERFPQFAEQLPELLSARAQTAFENGDTASVTNALEPTIVTGNPQGIVAEGSPVEIQQLRDYRILRELGRGGMGTVYLAVHQRLNRQVALKVLPPHLAVNQQAMQRFDREMQAIGGLRHENIVQATDAGHDNGRHYLVMEYLEGSDAETVIREQGPMQARDACLVARDAARGLEHILQHQMVHRDIKPSNLMITNDGQVKVLDLGLAMLRDPVRGERELTTTGQMMGTFSYMAPEQTGGAAHVDIRADIYSLGATLYFLLCGRAPFDSRDYETPLKQLVALGKDAPLSVADRVPGIPPALAELVLRCLEKEPTDRPQTPTELIAELERCIEQCTGFQDAPAETGTSWEADTISLSEDQAINSHRTGRTSLPARPPHDGPGDPSYDTCLSTDLQSVASAPSTAARTFASRWATRRMVAIGAALAGILLLAFFSGPVIRYATNQGQVVIEVDDPSIEVTVKEGGATLLDRKGGRTVTLAGGEHQLEVTVSDANGGDVTFHTDKFTLSRGGKQIVNVRLELAKLDRTTPPIAADTPDNGMQATWPLGRTKDVLPGILSRPAMRHGITRWQVETAAPRGGMYSMDLSPDGKWLACTSYDWHLRIYDAKTLQLVKIFLNVCDRDPNYVNTVAFSPDGTKLAFGGFGYIHLWNVPDWTKGERIPECSYNLAWNSDGTKLFSTGYIFDVPSVDKPTFSGVALERNYRVVSATWSPDDKLIAAYCSQAGICLFDTADGHQLADSGLSQYHGSGPLDCPSDWSPDGLTLAISVGNAVDLWDVKENKKIRSVPLPHGSRYVPGSQSIRWRGDGKAVAVGTSDGFIEVVDPNTGELTASIDLIAHRDNLIDPFDSDRVRSLAWSQDGKTLTAAYGYAYTGLVTVDVASRERLVERRSTFARSLQVSPDGKRIAVADNDGSVRILDSANGSQQLAFGYQGDQRHTGVVTDVAWSPDGGVVASCSFDGTIQFWDATTGAYQKMIDVGTKLRHVAWSSDGSKLAAVDNKGYKIYGVQSGRLFKEFQYEHTTQVAWHPTEPTLAWCLGASLFLWSLDTEDQPHLATELPGAYGSQVAWNSSGSQILVAGGHVFDVQANKVRPFSGASNDLGSLAWHPHDESIALGRNVNGITVHDIQADQQLHVVSDFRDYLGFSAAFLPDGKRFIAAAASGTIRSFSYPDCQPQWVTIMLPDGKSATLTGAGEAIDIPDNTTDELVYIVEREPGRQTLLPHDEFQALAQPE
jgi:serine/threonine protein kinase/WD40 repeat protein